MATRINPIAGRYFNSPQFAQAMSNLAGAFAPPSAQELLTGAQYQGAVAQNSRLADLWSTAGDDFDRKGMASGQWTPNQSLYAVDQGNLTARRGQDIESGDRRYGVDVGAQTQRDVAGINQRGAFLNDRFNTPLGPGETIPGMVGPEADLLGALGLPTETLPSRFGAPKAPSLDELQAGVFRGMPLDQQRAIVGSDVDLTEILSADGTPVYSDELSAIGQPVARNPGGQASMQFKTYRAPDGQTGTAVLNPNTGGMVDAATGQPLPAGTITGDVQGSAEDITGAQNSRFQGQATAISGALDQIDQLSALIQSSPASQGAVGALRGTAQNIIQTGNELGQFFGGTVGEVAAAVNSGVLDAGLASEMFDPSIPAIDMLANSLAWQIAKTFSGDRVSNEQLRVARDMVGASGAFQNQANSLARLGALREQLTRDAQRIYPTLPPDIQVMLNPYLSGRVAAGQPPAAAASARPRAVNFETGETVEWNGQEWVPVQ